MAVVGLHEAPRLVARIGQCFSTTVATLRVLRGEGGGFAGGGEVEPGYQGWWEEMAEVRRGPFTFSDGCGTISRDLMLQALVRRPQPRLENCSVSTNRPT